MKRLTWIVMVFAVCVFTAVGCKKGSGRTHAPVEIPDESAVDYITPPPLDDLADKLLKKQPRGAIPMDETEQQKKDREINEKNDEKNKAKQAQQKQANMLANMAKQFTAFRAARPASKLTLESFKLRLKRAGLNKERLALEGNQVEFELVFYADPTNRGHILAYGTEQYDESFLAAFADHRVELVRDADLKGRLLKQKMETVYSYCKAYIMQDAQRNFDGFKAYLRDQAPPQLAKAVDTGEIKVNLQAQPGQILACLIKIDTNETNKHPSVMAGGEIRFLEPEQVRQAFPN